MASTIDTDLSMYQVTFNGYNETTANLGAIVSSATKVQDYNYNGSGQDNLDVLGDTNYSSFSYGDGGDKFYVSYGKFSHITFAYYGTVTIGGTSGFIAVVYDTVRGGPPDGTYYFFATNSHLTRGSTGIVTQDTTGSSSPEQWNLTDNQPTCFCAGTLLATPEGEVAVETLRPGDRMLLADGTVRPVRWLGRQTVARLFADPLGTNPIRIRAGALGGGLPRRDLRVSPCHALLVDGLLAQAGALVNGVSIVREARIPQHFVYYHVELTAHALLLAEGTPAESFIDNVERAHFDNWEEYEALCGEGAALVEMDLPRAQSARQVPRATQQRLAAVAAALFGTAAAAA